MKVSIRELPVKLRSRYYVAVDGRVTPATAAAVRLGEGIYSFAEARTKADELQRSFDSMERACEAAHKKAAADPNTNNQITANRQAERLLAASARFCEDPAAEPEPSVLDLSTADTKLEAELDALLSRWSELEHTAQAIAHLAVQANGDRDIAEVSPSQSAELERAEDLLCEAAQIYAKVAKAFRKEVA